MVSDEFVHMGMPLIEYGSAVWVVANQNGSLSDKFGDVPYSVRASTISRNLFRRNTLNDDYQDAYNKQQR